MALAISFDFWNTLYGDGAEYQRKRERKICFQKVAGRYRKIDESETEAAFKAASDLFLNEWISFHRTPTAATRIAHMAACLDLPFDQNDSDELIQLFGNMIFTIPPAPIEGIKTVIDKLSHSFPLGIISDTGYISGKYIRRFLEQEKMLQFFQSTVFSDEHSHSKPHKSVFAKTAEALRVQISDLIHIGDLERTDIAGAKNAGCTAIKYVGVHNDASGIETPDFVLNNYAELFGLLNQIDISV